MIKRVAVLGSGTMGSQIAALLAENGIHCDLLDLKHDTDPNFFAKSAVAKLQTLKPKPVSDNKVLSLIEPGNFEDDLSRLAHSEWVIEAVSEDIDIKQNIWTLAAEYINPNTIISTNTSGIPISDISKALPQKIRPQFLGSHFCNPPKYLPLLELITTGETDSKFALKVSNIASNVLKRGVVVAKDVPNFIANTIGAYALMTILHAATEFNLGPDEVDDLTGLTMGRPVSATFRTLDVVGIDIFLAVINNSLKNTTSEHQRNVLTPPEYLHKMIDRGWTGQKSGQGFYKRVETAKGREILVLDLNTLEYRRRKSYKNTMLGDTFEKRIANLFISNNFSNQFIWRILSQMLIFSAEQVGYISNDLVSIDRAMRWGYAWELGPFETWDILGLKTSLSKMNLNSIEIPDWINSLSIEDKPFYIQRASGKFQAGTEGNYIPTLPASIRE
tara:strand:+ start:1893 stop:3227 length:1335 start_codon:yes stop_codon:yes gene_type:complete